MRSNRVRNLSCVFGMQVLKSELDMLIHVAKKYVPETKTTNVHHDGVSLLRKDILLVLVGISMET